MMKAEELNFVKGLTNILNEDYYGAHDEAEAIIKYIREHSANVFVGSIEANPSENKKDGEVAIAFADWMIKEKNVEIYDFEKEWIIMDGERMNTYTSERLYKMFEEEKEKATDH